MRERRALIAQGATAEQLAAWRQQNAARFSAQVQRANDMAAVSNAAAAVQPRPMITQVTVPEGASQEMADFLTTQADLQNRRAQLHNAQTPNAAAVFQQQNSVEIAAQQQRAQDLGTQAASQPRPVPPPLVIPANTPPQLAAFLTLRDQLMRERIALWNQNLHATPEARQAALAQWQQQNASRLTQLQTSAVNLSTSSTASLSTSPLQSQ